MTEVTEVGERGLERFLAIRNVVCSHDPLAPAEYLDWRRQADEMTWRIAVVEGADAGAGVALTGWHTPPGVGRLGIYVLEGSRRQGVGSTLLDLLGAWLGERGCTEADTDVRESDEPSLAWALRRGYAEIGRSSLLVLTLDDIGVPEAAPPPRVDIVTWAERPELARGMYEVYCEAAPDVPGEEETEPPRFEDWLSNDMQGSGDRPQATFVALVGGEVVGYAKLAIPSSGDDVAWHDLTGVRRAWRGRGIAGALKRTQIGWAKANGYRYLKTHNEERNEPIQRLNRRYGYRPEPGTIALRGPIPDRA